MKYTIWVTLSKISLAWKAKKIMRLRNMRWRAKDSCLLRKKTNWHYTPILSSISTEFEIYLSLFWRSRLV